MKRYSLLLVLLLAVGMVLAACGSSNSGSDGEWVSDVTILTGGEQGVYFPLGGAMARIISENVDGVTATGVVSGASVVNSNDINDGKAELGLVQNDIAFYAHEGSAMFTEVTNNFYGVATLYPEVVQIVTSADSGIVTVEDLRGKRVAVGDQGSGTEANAKQILEVHGITYDDLNIEFMSFGDASGGIQDGNIDAAFITAGTPTGAIEALKASREVRIVSISPDKIKELTDKYPYYTHFDLPSSVYGTSSDATTVAVQAMIIASKSLSDDQVYAMTKAIFENLDVIEATHARGKDITLGTALDGMSIELHPGAKRYFDEAK
ncbi:TAXI family TRAP transporter solute-binding subunit [Anaerobacillus alkaliphilus]|uniref:TAXI family TRAP transporter solute-binding subunit n=1 Tax=Anaerobacillus alkaliphilus TaxID=1548597 RepID=A0A4Q0VSR1_9BACI|nr:TAXI family TRAP transporter solute-binding subunit [Anaerobacillus alkaliphilus]RXJ00357.1 TAXI family TRAP transporter solute-binding subunit [Anaerobacillus alkaliphilus]